MAEAYRKAAQDIITALMAQRIIGLLEMVKVDDKEGMTAVRGGRRTQNLTAGTFNGRLVQKTGQRVGFR